MALPDIKLPEVTKVMGAIPPFTKVQQLWWREEGEGGTGGGVGRNICQGYDNLLQSFLSVLQGGLGMRLYCSVAGGSGEETILQCCRGVWGRGYIAVLQGGLGRRLYCSVAGGVWGRDYIAVLQGGSGGETILQCCRGVWGRDYIAVLQGGLGGRLYCSVAGGVWGGDYIAVLQGGLGRRLYCSVAGGVWGGDYIAVLQGGLGGRLYCSVAGGSGTGLGERIWHTQYAPLHVIRFKSRVVIHHVVMCGGDRTLADMLADEEEIVPADRKKHISATRSAVSHKQSFNCKAFLSFSQMWLQIKFMLITYHPFRVMVWSMIVPGGRLSSPLGPLPKIRVEMRFCTTTTASFGW